jgi:hypothetical protein
MDNPFYYGGKVDRPYFINREKEIAVHLAHNEPRASAMTAQGKSI